MSRCTTWIEPVTRDKGSYQQGECHRSGIELNSPGILPRTTILQGDQQPAATWQIVHPRARHRNSKAPQRQAALRNAATVSDIGAPPRLLADAIRPRDAGCLKDLRYFPDVAPQGHADHRATAPVRHAARVPEVQGAISATHPEKAINHRHAPRKWSPGAWQPAGPSILLQGRYAD